MQGPLEVMSSINNNPSEKKKKKNTMELHSSFDSISATNLDTKSGGGWIAGMTEMHNDQEDVVSDHNGSILIRNQCLNSHHNDTPSTPSITTQTSTIEVVILGPNQPHPYAEPNRGDYKNHTHHWEVDDTVEPITICIGYIFASKKMNTMSVVMAEASKVRLGLLCTTTMTNLCTTSATTSPALSSCSARDRCHKGDNTTITSEIHNEIMHALDNDTSKYDNHNQFTLTQARLLTHEGASGATLIRNFHPDHHSQSYKNINQKHHTYGTSKNKKSSYNGSSTSTSSSQQQQPSNFNSSNPSSSTATTSRCIGVIVGNATSSSTGSGGGDEVWPYIMQDPKKEAQQFGLTVPVVMIRRDDGRRLVQWATTITPSTTTSNNGRQDDNDTMQQLPNNNIDNDNNNYYCTPCRIIIRDKDSESNSCPVCADPFAIGDTIVRLPNCGHVFHENCALMWLTKHNTCPYCRSEMATEDEEYESERRRRQRRQTSRNEDDEILNGNGHANFYG